MRRCWKCLAATAGLVPVAGLLIAWLGLVPVGATGGHWAVTEWFLHWTMRSSVRTAALGIEKPASFEKEAHLRVAAAHFETGCAECHGSPVERRSAEVLAMLPPPPDLKASIRQWKDEELFVIVRDGLRYTGMPAWPGRERENEVWSMVAFLRELPDMNAARYQELAGGMSAGKGSAFSSCLSCHSQSREDGDDGSPVIAGQSELYLKQALNAYIDGDRESGFMEVAVSKLEPSDIVDAAHHFSNRTGGKLSAKVTAPAVDTRVLTLVHTGDPVQKVAGCNACHDGRNPRYPLLAGQSRSYLRQQLLLFRSGGRKESATELLMSQAVRNLSDDDVERLAAYYASIPSTGTPR
ncbi:c-type cytochrome [Ensifer sp.]|uniref:c-type cytochrome n=1 Tax=Ensifer sp. TaxID=1872086 RepID=UPI00289A7B9E|nr:c-type cytochrome [Ensifer sp.]